MLKTRILKEKEEGHQDSPSFAQVYLRRPHRAGGTESGLFPVDRYECGIRNDSKQRQQRSLCSKQITVQSSSLTQSCPTLCDPMACSTPGLPVHQQFLEFTRTHVHWVNDVIQPSHPPLSPSPPAFKFLSIRVFSDGSVLCIRWPKFWTFSFSICPYNEYSGWIYLRTVWLALHAVQENLKSLLQHQSSKASIL